MKNYLFFLILLSSTVCGQRYTKAEIALITSGETNSALPIYQTSDSLQHQVLLSKSRDAKPKNRNTKLLIERMKKSLLSTQGGVGIAAPQVGINRNIIWVQRFDKEGQPLNYFINPKITWRSQALSLGPEGDLSIAAFRDQFYRSQAVQVEYFDTAGKKYTEILEGFTAVILQHEIDHLSGMLITEKIKDQSAKTFDKIELYKERLD